MHRRLVRVRVRVRDRVRVRARLGQVRVAAVSTVHRRLVRVRVRVRDRVRVRVRAQLGKVRVACPKLSAALCLLITLLFGQSRQL